jgi:hypothetical protein
MFLDLPYGPILHVLVKNHLVPEYNDIEIPVRNDPVENVPARLASCFDI